MRFRLDRQSLTKSSATQALCMLFVIKLITRFLDGVKVTLLRCVKRKQGEWVKAFTLLDEMRVSGVKINSMTYSAAIKVC